jgi:hypothetical protein
MTTAVAMSAAYGRGEAFEQQQEDRHDRRRAGAAWSTMIFLTLGQFLPWAAPASRPPALKWIAAKSAA